MPVEDAVGDHPRRHTVTDPVDGLDTLVGDRCIGAESVVQRVVRASLRDENDTVDLDLDDLARTRSRRRRRPGPIPVTVRLRRIATPAS